MTYICECGKEFNNKKSLISHYTHCDIHCQCNGKKLKRKPHVGSMNWENRTPEEIQLSHLKSGQTLKNKIKSGEFTPYWKGKHHSEKTKQLLREKYVERIKNEGRIATYNKNACDFFDKLNKEKNWNLQHAQNGGEYVICGFWLDAYDQKNNIVVEYDEPKHYIDVKNNVLRDKDIERQNIIIHNLKCKFYRYNSKMNIFYEAYLNNDDIYEEFDKILSNNLIDFSNYYTIKHSLKIYSKYSFKSFKIYCEYHNINIEKKKKTNKQLKLKIIQENKQNRENQKQINRNILINAISNSNIDFSKSGWSGKLYKYLKDRNELIDKCLYRCIKRYYPEFLQSENIWKRKGTI